MITATGIPFITTVLFRHGDRVTDLRRAAIGTPAGSPARVALADAVTAVDDLRAVYCLATLNPDQLDRNGYRLP